VYNTAWPASKLGKNFAIELMPKAAFQPLQNLPDLLVIIRTSAYYNGGRLHF